MDEEAASPVDLDRLVRFEVKGLRSKARMIFRGVDMPHTNRYWPDALFVLPVGIIASARRARIASRNADQCITIISQKEQSVSDFIYKTEVAGVEDRDIAHAPPGVSSFPTRDRMVMLTMPSVLILFAGAADLNSASAIAAVGNL